MNRSEERELKARTLARMAALGAVCLSDAERLLSDGFQSDPARGAWHVGRMYGLAFKRAEMILAIVPRVPEGKVLHVNLWYPRSPGPRAADEPTEIRVGLMDVRAADDLVIDYDFERDGYRIRMTANSDAVDEDEERLVEVAFVPGGIERPA